MGEQWLFLAQNCTDLGGHLPTWRPRPGAPPVSFWLKTWIWQGHDLGSRMATWAKDPKRWHRAMGKTAWRRACCLFYPLYFLSSWKKRLCHWPQNVWLFHDKWSCMLLQYVGKRIGILHLGIQFECFAGYSEGKFICCSGYFKAFSKIWHPCTVNAQHWALTHHLISTVADLRRYSD